MPTIDEIKQHLSDATKNLTDANDLKAVGSVLAELDQTKADEDKLLNAYADLKTKYRESIINGAFPPQQSKDESGSGAPAQAPLTVEECLNQVLKDAQKENKK